MNAPKCTCGYDGGPEDAQAGLRGGIVDKTIKADDPYCPSCGADWPQVAEATRTDMSADKQQLDKADILARAIPVIEESDGADECSELLTELRQVWFEAHHEADPHCTCNDCIAAHDEATGG